LEEDEKRDLATYAVLSRNTKGRKVKEKQDDDRLCFQKDKDRIVHSKAFRRLEEKTQVFMAGVGDHYRTRLTHTLEVAQIARDLARRLGLNEDLCEAIGLAHDLGHPPFGHGGESALNDVMQALNSSFEHNEQSRRIVEKMERSYPNFDGLNLSLEVIEGLLKHQTAFDQEGKKFEFSAHLEAQIVNVADEIAYTNHDMDDGIRSGILSLNDLKKQKLWQIAQNSVEKQYGEFSNEDVLVSRVVSAITSMMIDDLCKQTEKNIKEFGITTLEDVHEFSGILARFSENMKEMVAELRGFLFDNFYMSPKINRFVLDGQTMIKELFQFYLKNPQKMEKKEFLREEESIEITVKDYIAGMTDRFLIEEYKRHIKID